MILRSMTAADADKFYALMCECAHRELPRGIFAEYLAEALRMPGRRILLAFEGAEAVGFADCLVVHALSACAPVGEIRDFFVSEEARGHGVGTGLLLRLTADLKKAGCSSLRASCARVNLKSQEFLEKRGFSKAQHTFVRALGG